MVKSGVPLPETTTFRSVATSFRTDRPVAAIASKCDAQVPKRALSCLEPNVPSRSVDDDDGCWLAKRTGTIRRVVLHPPLSGKNEAAGLFLAKLGIIALASLLHAELE